MLLVSIALAQTVPRSDNIGVPRLDADLLHRALATRGTFVTEDAGRIRDEVVAGFQLGMGYANAPLVVSWDAGGTREQASVVRDLVGVNAIATLEFDRLRLGLDLPFYALATSDIGDSGTSLGNVGLDARLTALDPTKSPVGIGLIARLDLPSDTRRAVASPRVGFELAGAVERSFGDLTVIANAGYRGLPKEPLYNIVWDDLVFGRLATTWALSEDSGLSAEAVVSTLARSVDTLGAPRGAPTPAELLGGGWLSPVEGIALRGALGAGLSGGIGAPRMRALVDVVWTPRTTPQDTDGDGIVDRDDSCPSEAEDLDGFQDSDGCSDPDNDGDGRVDAMDACPDEAEDVDGYEDSDGCPDPTQNILIRVVDSKGVPVGGAILQISGEEMEPTSSKELDLHPGSYVVVAFAGGYKPAQVDLEVTGGKDRVLQVVLDGTAPGTARLVLAPGIGAIPDGLEAKIGAKKVRFASGVAEVQVPSGRTAVRIEARPGVGAFLGQIRVRAGESTELSVALGPPIAKLEGDRIRLSQPVDFEQDEPSASSGVALHQVASILDTHPGRAMRITVGGAGAQARADALRSWLIGVGIASNRLEAVGSEQGSEGARFELLPE